MKKVLFFALFSFLSFFAFSQINTSIDIIGSYDIINEFTYKFDLTDGPTTSRQNYRFGANFNFRVFDQGFIKTGIRYVKQVHNVFENQFIDEYYIEVPLLFRYEFSKRKFSLYAEVGISPHFILKSKYVQQISLDHTTTDYEGQSINGINFPYLKDRRVHLGYIIGIGFNYLFSQKMQLFFQPTYRYYPLIGDPSVIINGTKNFGVEFGVRRVLSFK